MIVTEAPALASLHEDAGNTKFESGDRFVLFDRHTSGPCIVWYVLLEQGQYCPKRQDEVWIYFPNTWHQEKSGSEASGVQLCSPDDS